MVRRGADGHARISGTAHRYTTQRNAKQKRNEDCPGFLNSTGRLKDRIKTSFNCCVAPCAFSGIPERKGTKSEMAASPLPSPGPKGPYGG